MLKINTYTFSLVAVCPADSALIDYACEINSEQMIRVEDINEWKDGIKSGFHEDIADAMASKFGGAQKIEAVHQGVRITTRRIVGEPGLGDVARADSSAEPVH